MNRVISIDTSQKGNCLHLGLPGLYYSLVYRISYIVSRHTIYEKRDSVMPDKDIDIKRIQELIEIMKANGLEELEIQEGDSKVALKRHFPHSVRQAAGPLPIHTQAAGAESSAPASDTSAQAGTQHEKNLIELKSPIVGTFYAKPSPDSDAYVEIGSKVDTRTVVCIIEAMKVMNEIRAETDGTIVQVCITNGQAVEYGQVLFKVRPD